MSDITPTEAPAAEKAYTIPAKLETPHTTSESHAPIDMQEAKKQLHEKLLTHCDTTEQTIQSRAEGLNAKITEKIATLTKGLNENEKVIAEQLLAQSKEQTLPKDTIKAMVDTVAKSSQGLVASRVKEGYKNAVKMLGIDAQKLPEDVKQLIGNNPDKITPKDIVEFFIKQDDDSLQHFIERNGITGNVVTIKEAIRTTIDADLQKALSLCPENQFIQLSVAKLQERLGITAQNESAQPNNITDSVQDTENVSHTNTTDKNIPQPTPAAEPVIEQPHTIIPSVDDIQPAKQVEQPTPPEHAPVIIDGIAVGTTTYDHGLSADIEDQQQRATRARENSMRVAAEQANRTGQTQEDTQNNDTKTQRIPAADGGAGLEAYQQTMQAARENSLRVAEKQGSVVDAKDTTATVPIKTHSQEKNTPLPLYETTQQEITTVQDSLAVPMNLPSFLDVMVTMKPEDIKTFAQQYHEMDQKATSSLPQEADVAPLLALKQQIATAESASEAVSFFRNPLQKLARSRELGTLQKAYDRLDEAARTKYGSDYALKVGKRNDNFMLTVDNFSLPFQDAKEILALTPVQQLLSISETYTQGSDITSFRKAQEALKPIIEFSDNYKKHKEETPLVIPTTQEEKAA